MNVIDCYILLCYHDDGFAAESAVVYILAVIHVCVWVPTKTSWKRAKMVHIEESGAHGM